MAHTNDTISRPRLQANDQDRHDPYRDGQWGGRQKFSRGAKNFTGDGGKIFETGPGISGGGGVHPWSGCGG